MATNRLRTTFKYLADDSEDDNYPYDLDEEEQEKLITKLKQENDRRNEQYKRLFLAIPIAAASGHIPALFMSHLMQAKLVSFLCMSSLVATAYILIFVPNTRVGPTSRTGSTRLEAMETGPVHQCIGYLNAALSTLCALNAINFRGKTGVHEGFWLLCLLPILSYSIILFARHLMLSVDLGELEKLKYGYKGA